MLSPRFGIIVGIILCIALIPTIIHNYIGAKAEDGFRASAISMTLAGLSSEATNRKATWAKDTFDADDWMERNYSGPSGENVLLFVARSYDLKRLYHHPEIGILHGVDLKKEGMELLSGRPDVLVHVLRGRSGKGMAAYVLLYDRQFIENPISQQLLTSVQLLFNPRKAMMLFFVYDSEMKYGAPLKNSIAARILAEAVSNFFSETQGNAL